MPKYKIPTAKKTAPPPRAGLPCLIIVIVGIVGLFVFLFLVMKYAS